MSLHAAKTRSNPSRRPMTAQTRAMHAGDGLLARGAFPMPPDSAARERLYDTIEAIVGIACIAAVGAFGEEMLRGIFTLLAIGDAVTAR